MGSDVTIDAAGNANIGVGTGVPMVLVICGACKYVMHFAAKPLGVV